MSNINTTHLSSGMELLPKLQGTELQGYPQVRQRKWGCKSHILLSLPYLLRKDFLFIHVIKYVRVRNKLTNNARL